MSIKQVTTPYLSGVLSPAKQALAICFISLLWGTGCSGSFNPWSKVAKVGVHLVGDAIQEADVDEHAKNLIG